MDWMVIGGYALLAVSVLMVAIGIVTAALSRRRGRRR